MYFVGETQVTGHLRSLEIALFDRSYTTSYLSSTITMALFYTVFDIVDFKKSRVSVV